MTKELDKVSGGGGGGGGGSSSSPTEAPNTLLTKTIAKVLFLVSDGETEGLACQETKLKSVYLNNVPVMAEDGSLNTKAATVVERYGLPDQTPISGYPSASSAFNLGVKVTTSSPATYQTSNTEVDAIRVTIRFAALFEQQSDGDTVGTTVEFQIWTARLNGAYSLRQTITKTDKTTSPADVDYLVNRPGTTGLWTVKIVRITPNNASTTKANDIYFQTATEVENSALAYPNRSYIGLTLSSETTGSVYPVVSFDIYGVKIKVPSNYDPKTRTYSGVWNGTFAAEKQVCNNPAWVLYDLLTNARHGMGTVISEDDIDKYSFYDAAVYNDGAVPAIINNAYIDTGVATEPRFTFNHQFMDQEDSWTLIQTVAASFCAAVYTSGNQIRLVQDRPTSWSRVITNSNVVEGMFEYSSSQLANRTSACLAYWINPFSNWVGEPIYYEDSAGTARYGKNTKEITVVGCTLEAQAYRMARWHVETSLYNTDSVIFKVGLSNAGIEPGEVLKIADTDYAMSMIEAKIARIDSPGNTLLLDRQITFANGDELNIVGNNQQIYTVNITGAGAGTFIGDYIQYSGANLTGSVDVGADLILTSYVSPRLFKVTNVNEESPGVWTVSAVQYDEGKFARVDAGWGATPLPIQNPTQATYPTTPSVPNTLSFRESAYNNNSVSRRILTVSWSRPTSGTIKNYLLRYRNNNTTWRSVDVNSLSFDINPAAEGVWDVEVYARSNFDVVGPAAEGTYTISTAGSGTTNLQAPTGLNTTTTADKSFSGENLNLMWYYNGWNPLTSEESTSVLRDFEVKIYRASDSQLLRTTYAAADVPVGGSIAGPYYYSYSRSFNAQDNAAYPISNTLSRQLYVEVRCRDMNNNLSDPITATFTNYTPGVPTPITVTGALGSVQILVTPPSTYDYMGYGGILVWRSTTNGFTPTGSNLIYRGRDSYIVDNALTPGTTYYYKIAAYDAYLYNSTFSDLTFSAQYTATPIKSAGINAGTTLPGSGNTEGDFFYNTVDGQLYRYHSGTWTATVPASGVTGQLTNAQIAAIAAAKITGQITSTQITDDAITTPKIATGAVSTNELAAGAVIAEKITAGTITGNKLTAEAIGTRELAANSVAAGKIQAYAITSSKLAANSVTAGAIAANSISADKIVAGAVTANKIAVGALSEISSGAGIIVAGLLRNAANTAFIDLDATGTDMLIGSGSDVNYGPVGIRKKVEIRANGDAFFARSGVGGGQLIAYGYYAIPTAQRPAIYITP